MHKTAHSPLSLGLGSIAFGQLNSGVNVLSRDVWRGSDFGNSATLQHSIEYAWGDFTLAAGGAWSPGSAGDDPDFGIVNLSVSARRDIYTLSYILNPEQETSFLVFGFYL